MPDHVDPALERIGAPDLTSVIARVRINQATPWYVVPNEVNRPLIFRAPTSINNLSLSLINV
jgi:hypothetical protein